MAIIRDDNEFKNKNVNVGGGASQLGGGYSSGGGSATGPQAGNVPSSSWTNIQEYLGNAGQGAPIAEGMSGEVETQGMDVQKGIQGWENDVGNQIIQGTPTFDEGIAKANNLPTAPKVEYGGPTDPTKTTGYQGLRDSSDALTKKANELGSWSGIQGYLKGTVKGPYTQGMSNYDTLLAQTSGGDLMGRTKAKYNQTGKQIDTAASNLSTAAKNAGYQANAVQGQWNDYTAKINADAKAATDKAAQEGALKNMNAGIAQQWILPGTEKPLEDLTKINQDIAAKNNESAFYSKQRQDAADAAERKKIEENRKRGGGLTMPEPLEDLRYGLKGVGKEAKNVGDGISKGFKKLRRAF